jgi:LysM repeat protein
MTGEQVSMWYNCVMVHTKPGAAAFLAAVLALCLTGCGQVITRPTPAAAKPTATPTQPVVAPTPLPTPTATVDTYTPAPTATATATPEPIIYRVVAGDTLDRIAARYDVPKNVLREINGIENELALQVDQDLIIPVTGWGGPAEPTPTVTATPLPVAIENVTFQPSALGELTVLGEVRNLSAVDLERVLVQIALFDELDRPLVSRAATMALDAVAPGQRAPFAMHFDQVPRFASYQATVLAAAPAYVGSLVRSLEPQGVSMESMGDGIVRLDGRIRNVGDQEAVDVFVVATVYDPLGRVAGMRRVPTEPGTIAFGGGEAEFSVEIVPAGPVVTYTIQSQGRLSTTQ